VPPRQVWLFKFGCWAAIATAVVHVAGTIAGGMTPTNDTERQLLELATTYQFALPGGAGRSLVDFLRGLSLVFSVFFATIGPIGLVVARRGQADPFLMYGVARRAAIASAAVLVISLAYFFIVPTLCVATVTVCFAASAVKAPGI
jgi:hypothetical protein